MREWPPSVRPRLHRGRAGEKAALTHQLKCWGGSFDAIERGDKRADVRSNDDRDFQIGDVLEFIRWDHDLDRPTGRRMQARVTHITMHAGDLGMLGVKLSNGGRPGRMTGLVVLSLERMASWEVPPA